jgi:pimeloyl-ACP methyl ester carboxylesterase
MRSELRKIGCPALVMQGAEDEQGSQEQARGIAAAITGAELVLFPEAGHMLPRDNADEVNRRLSIFLGKVLKQERADVQ